MANTDGFHVVAVSFFGKWSVATFPTREQAEWRAKELNDWSERYPRGHIQYLVRPSQDALCAFYYLAVRPVLVVT